MEELCVSEGELEVVDEAVPDPLDLVVVSVHSFVSDCVTSSLAEADDVLQNVWVDVALTSQMIVSSMTSTFWHRQPVYVWVGVEYG